MVARSARPVAFDHDAIFLGSTVSTVPFFLVTRRDRPPVEPGGLAVTFAVAAVGARPGIRRRGRVPGEDHLPTGFATVLASARPTSRIRRGARRDALVAGPAKRSRLARWPRGSPIGGAPEQGRS